MPGTSEPGRAIRITVTIGSAPPRMLELASPVLCGSGRAADIRITDPTVAPLHVRLARDGDAIVALAIAPGVHIDGVAVAVDEPLVVTGRGVQIGPARVVAGPWAESAQIDPARTDSLARELMRDLLGERAPPAPELIVESGPVVGQRVTLTGVGTRIVIGRGDGGWVVLDPDLSRAHAAIEHRGDGAWIYDLDSKNGTRVNDRAAPTAAPGVVLCDGDLIALGGTTIRFRDPAAAALGGATAMLAADTRTHGQAPITAVSVPPRWPIVVAAVVAIAALATAAALLV